MATRTVYVNPGDLLDIRIIRDAELPRTATEWKYQVRPGQILLKVEGSDELSFRDPSLRLTLRDTSGNPIRAGGGDW